MAEKRTFPEYTVRVSPRAKRVTIRVSPGRGVEVVAPRGFDLRRVPALLRGREEWIRKQIRRFRLDAETGAPDREMPDAIELRAVGRSYEVHYLEAGPDTAHVRANGPDRLLVRGGGRNPDSRDQALLAWLKEQGRLHLPPLLRGEAGRAGLAVERIQIRCQRSRWGSCSARGTISLNCNLLFLPRDMARYVLLHELAHTVHLNHSPEYWRFLAGLVERAVDLDRELSGAWRYVPPWVIRAAG